MSERITPEQFTNLRSAADLFGSGNMKVRVSEVRALLDHIDSLADLNRNLSNQLVGMSDRLQIAANAWDEGQQYGSTHPSPYIAGFGVIDSPAPNPYKEARDV